MNTNTLNPTPNTPHPASNKELTQLREHQVWELRVQCYSQFDIAQELGISQAAVSQILKRVRARLAAEFAAGAADALTEQVEQLMHIAQEALAAWKQSKSPTKAPEAPPISPTQNPEELNTAPGREQSETEQRVRSTLGAPAPYSEGIHSVAPKEGKSAFLRIAIQALAAVRAIRATFQPEENPCDDNVKMIVGIDLDHMKYKDGTLVPRKEVDRIMARQAG